MKLKFIFKTNSLNIDESLEYKISKDNIIFDYKGEHYIFDINKNKIVKENDESIITIKIDDSLIRVYSKELKRAVEIPVINVYFKKGKKIFEYEYKVEDDVDINNKIKIEY